MKKTHKTNIVLLGLAALFVALTSVFALQLYKAKSYNKSDFTTSIGAHYAFDPLNFNILAYNDPLKPVSTETVASAPTPILETENPTVSTVVKSKPKTSKKPNRLIRPSFFKGVFLEVSTNEKQL